MIKNFIRSHLNQILTKFEQLNESIDTQVPLDVHLRQYLKQHKSIGANDRRVIAENVFSLTRNKIFLDFISPKPLSWNAKLDTMYSQVFENQKQNSSILPFVRCSCPKELWHILCEAYGEGKAYQYIENQNNRAPLTVRVNPMKITRDELLKRWQTLDKFACRASTFSPYGIVFTTPNNQNLIELPEFKRGYFEIQDEGSQLLSLRVKAQENQKVLDYCAGSGGKSLAFGPYMKNTGKIYLYDTRRKALMKAKLRFARSGMMNVTFVNDLQELSKFKNYFDWIVLDVPCTGTGTFRRNPDLKYRFNKLKFQHYIDLQQSIIDNAIQYLNKKNGKIVYSTCSILPQENLEQVIKACKKHNLEIVDDKHFQTFPEEKNGMDSFFSATLQYKA